MSGTDFKDHFSERAAGYAAFRPRYPDALFTWLAGLTKGHDQAWDAGTGNGQAAIGLAPHFARVVATDASEKQIARAEARANVRYAVGREGASGLPPASCDLVTAAQALHWFDVPAFFAEAGRVLKPEGAIAVWTYGAPVLDDARANELLQSYARMIHAFWPPERAMVDEGYRGLAFPFDEVAAPAFRMEQPARREDLTGYLRTTSAQQRYVAERGTDPVAWLAERLAPIWPDDRRHRLSWPVSMRAGRPMASFRAS